MTHPLSSGTIWPGSQWTSARERQARRDLVEMTVRFARTSGLARMILARPLSFEAAFPVTPSPGERELPRKDDGAMSLFARLLQAVRTWRRRRGGPKTFRYAGIAMEQLDHRQLLSVNFTGNVPIDFPATQVPGVVVLPDNPLVQ